MCLIPVVWYQPISFEDLRVIGHYLPSDACLGGESQGHVSELVMQSRLLVSRESLATVPHALFVDC